MEANSVSGIVAGSIPSRVSHKKSVHIRDALFYEEVRLKSQPGKLLRFFPLTEKDQVV
jgi:hypothetical protein